MIDLPPLRPPVGDDDYRALIDTRRALVSEIAALYQRLEIVENQIRARGRLARLRYFLRRLRSG